MWGSSSMTKIVFLDSMGLVQLSAPFPRKSRCGVALKRGPISWDCGKNAAPQRKRAAGMRLPLVRAQAFEAPAPALHRGVATFVAEGSADASDEGDRVRRRRVLADELQFASFGSGASDEQRWIADHLSLVDVAVPRRDTHVVLVVETAVPVRTRQLRDLAHEVGITGGAGRAATRAGVLELIVHSGDQLRIRLAAAIGRVAGQLL